LTGIGVRGTGKQTDRRPHPEVAEVGTWIVSIVFSRLIPERSLIGEGEDLGQPAERAVGGGRGRSDSRREPFVGGLEVQHGHRDLPQVVGARGPSPRFSHSLNRREQEADQNADDADDHQQFDQGKGESF